MRIQIKWLVIVLALKLLPAMAQSHDSHGNLMSTANSVLSLNEVVGTTYFPASASTQATLIAGNILFDDSKPRSVSPAADYYADLIQLLNNQGHTVSSNGLGVTNQDLNTFDVIVLSVLHADGEYTADEITALESFANSGGGIVILGEADACNLGACARGNLNLSQISNAIANISIETNTLKPTPLFFSSLASHPVFTGVSQLYFQFANSIRVPTPEFILARTDDKQHTLIAGVGNLFVLTDTSIMSSNDFLDIADNRLFTENLFNYLISGSVTNPVNEQLSLEKRINNFTASERNQPVNLLAGAQYRAQYTVTNNFEHRIYRVNVYDNQAGQEVFVCTLYSLNPGESKRCEKNSRTLTGLNNVDAVVRAFSSIDSSPYFNRANSWYDGHLNVRGQLQLKHFVNNKLADRLTKAEVVASGEQIEWLFAVKNSGVIDLYRIILYSDAVSPIDSGWQQQCHIGKLKAGATRFCRVTSIAGEGIHHTIGRAQGLDTGVGFGQKVNAANATYYSGR